MSQISQDLHNIAAKVTDAFLEGFEQAVNMVTSQLKAHLKNSSNIQSSVLQTLIASAPVAAAEAVITGSSPVEAIVETAADAVIEATQSNSAPANTSPSVNS